MPYFDILLNGQSIKDKVTGFQVNHSQGDYVKTAAVSLADYSLYSDLDFSTIKSTEMLKIVTAEDADVLYDGVTDGTAVLSSASGNFASTDVVPGDYLQILSGVNAGLYAISMVTDTSVGVSPSALSAGSSIGFVVLRYLGKFFVEDIDVLRDIKGDAIPSLWGRSTLARLGPPHAHKVTKTWRTRTSMYAVFQEMLESAGIPYIESNIGISNYPINKDTLAVSQQYPIDVVRSLVEVTNGYISTNRHGEVLVKKYLFHLASPVRQFTDSVISAEWRTSIKYPDFGNRIRVSTASSRNRVSACFYASPDCIPADGASRIRFAIVTRAEGGGAGPTGAEVRWSLSDDSLGTLDNSTTYTQSALITNEIVRASDYKTVIPRYPPVEVLGVWAFKDKKHEGVNFFTKGGNGSISDKGEIKLSTALFFCDQKVRVTYKTAGISFNQLKAGTTPGRVTVFVDVLGTSARYDVPIGLGCNCPYDIQLVVEEPTILVGETTNVIVCASRGGAPATFGRGISFGTRRKLGTFSPPTVRLGNDVKINQERTTVFHEEGKSKVAVGAPVYSVTSIGTTRGDALTIPSGGISRNIITVILQGRLVPPDTEVIVTYNARGCGMTVFTAGAIPGRDYIVAHIRDTTEGGTEAWHAIDITTVGETNDPTDGDQFPIAAPFPDTTPRPLVPLERDECSGTNTLQGGNLQSFGRGPDTRIQDDDDSNISRPPVNNTVNDCVRRCRGTANPVNCAYHCMDCEGRCAGYGVANDTGGFDMGQRGPYANYNECLYACLTSTGGGGYGLTCMEMAELDFFRNDRAVGATVDGELVLFETCTNVAEAAGQQGTPEYQDAYAQCKEESIDKDYGCCWSYQCAQRDSRRNKADEFCDAGTCSDHGGIVGQSEMALGPSNAQGTFWYWVSREYCADGQLLESVGVSPAPKCFLDDNISKISAYYRACRVPELYHLTSCSGGVWTCSPTEDQVMAAGTDLSTCVGGTKAYAFCSGAQRPDGIENDVDNTRCPFDL